MSWVLGLAIVACDTADPPATAAAASVAAPQPGPGPLLDGERGLRALAWVNQPDLDKAKPYEERHALLRTLGASADARHIDRRLNLALDLRQAADAPDPCGTYGSALGRIAQSADAYYAVHLKAATPPSTCAALGTERDEVLAKLTRAKPTVAKADPQPPTPVVDQAPEEPAPATTRSSSTKSKKPRKRKSTGSTKSTPAATPPPAEPKTPKKTGVASKIDEELKPFGM